MPPPTRSPRPARIAMTNIRRVIFFLTFNKKVEDMSSFCLSTNTNVMDFPGSTLGFKARVDSLFVCFLVCMQCILRFIYGMTPADLLMASMAAERL